ncbi:MAG: Sec-independent protein translocase protein TatB [Sedimenticola sp.]|uniref:Sec-independent protein translocase protein TatB n=1 Tax=Sedimenticola thiotaurini TaxID=1543721 RepID=A0A558CZE8_9GAMM|nr:Sec-independent protein translocase protein TatB [Sedimenticola sp.]MCW8977163.1 Sec-independent protein translocase protein TatB [Sedimenticola sp.]MCW9022360.1 Sec-independent protein translocase protein TatB [Sedimenticola sp.]MDF1530206.1 Sec-independent protein translocase protein TatB [Sedimenticola sp.]TVT54108.1 MAG: twin-arginine translocase subunit TatB [Sedimenticola thiotaurini]
MFDIGFWELAIIALVALVVVGPERLPKLAYTAGKWMGKGRKMLSQVKAEIDKEMKAEELKQILEEQKKQMDPLHEIVEETKGTLNEFANETNKTAQEIEKTEATEAEVKEPPVDSPK